MIVKTFPVNPFEMNCYVYYDESSNEALIIDPAAYSEPEKENILSLINKEKLNLKAILNTHGHIDHILGNAWAKETFKIPILMHKDDLELIQKSAEQASLFGIDFPQPPHPDKFIDEDYKLDIGDCILKILHTPGHSPGSITLVDEKNKLIFAGDCVFKNSIGRTDLWKGDMDILLSSIKNKIFPYADGFIIYPVHYEATTIGEEKLNNPFLN